MHYKIPVVFRVTKYGDWKGTLDVVHANVREDGLETADTGDRYSNDWYLNSTRLASPEEYADKLKYMNSITFGEDTYEFIPKIRRNFS